MANEQLAPVENPRIQDAVVQVLPERAAPPIEGAEDASNEYMDVRQNRAIEVEANEMRDWALSQDRTAIRKKSAESDIKGEPLDPFPTDRQPPEEQSTAGVFMRNVSEIPRGIGLGVDSAIRHATDWAIGPLVEWLDKNVANLQVPVAEPTTTTGKIAKSASEFIAGFVPAMRAMRAVGVTGKVMQPLAASAIADFATRDPHEARLSNLWKEAGLPENILTDYMAADPSDGQIEGRFKSALESILTGAALEGVVLSARALRAAKRVKVVQEAEDRALIEQYGEFTDDDIAKVVGDPSKPIVEVTEKITKATEDLRAPRGPKEHAAYGVTILEDAETKYKTIDKSIVNESGDRVGKVSGNETATEVKIENAAIDDPESFGKGFGVKAYSDIADYALANGKILTSDNEITKEAANVYEALARRGYTVEKDPKAVLETIDGAERWRAEGPVYKVTDKLRVGTDNIVGGKGVVDASEMKVYVNFSRIGGPDDVKAAIAEMSDRLKSSIDESRRDVITFEETKRMADGLGMTVTDLLARRKGQPFNAEEALAARRLWQSSGDQLVELARKASAPNAGPLDQFAFRKAMAVHAAIQSEVIGARTETARALASWRITAEGGIERARAIQQIMDAMGGPEASQEMARRLAILAEHGDPAFIAKFVEKGWGAKSFDALREVWVNGLLSSPATHIVNTLSNTVVAFQQILERGVAQRIGEFTGSQNIAPGEALAMSYGLISAVKDAFRLSWKALKTGETGASLNKIDLPMQPAVSSEAFKIGSETALGRGIDLIGTVARVPGRLLGAEDEFFKTIGYRMELHAQALRQATSEGLTGNALSQRMREIILDPPQHIRIKSADAALYSTFTNAPGDVGKIFLKLRERVPVVSFILPFIRTPVNIARYTFERTPFAPLVSQWRDDIAAGGARADLALARMSTGTMAMLAAADFADSGLISGRGPKDAGELDAMMRQGWQQYSINVGGKWYSYNRTDPLGSMIGFAADAAEAIRHGEMSEDDIDEWQEIMATGIAAVSQVAVNKTYLRGLSEFINVMSDPQRYGEGYIKNFAASFIPGTALAGAIERAVDPVVRETTTPWEAINAKLAGLSDKLPPRLTLWGEEIRAESGLGKAYDFFSPVQVREIKPEPIDTEITRLAPLAAMDNVEGSAPTRIGKRTTFGGVQVNFKEWPKVYEEYVRLSGNELKPPGFGMGAKDLLNAVVEGKSPLSAVYNIRSDEMKIVFIKQVISQYRKLAQQAIMDDPEHKDFAEYVRKLKGAKMETMLPVTQ